MHWYFAKAFHSQVTGTRQETVKCQKCKTVFCYELQRTGNGKAEAPYYLGQASAAARAKTAAEKDLVSRLQREAELVPCPKCHWTNTDLIDRYRRPAYRRAMKITAACLICALMFVAVAGIVASQAHRNDTFPEWAIGGLITIGLITPIGLIASRRWVRAQSDPNANYPRRPIVPPGTPPAMLERVDLKTGRRYFEPVVSDYSEGRQDGFVIFRSGQINFPPICCVCSEPADTVYAPMIKFDSSDRSLGVPLCKSCARSISLRWWLWAAGTLIASAAVAAGIAPFVPGIDQFGRWMIFGTLSIFGAAIGIVVLPASRTRPYRLKIVDAARGVFALSTGNPSFDQILAEQVQQSELRSALRSA